MKKIVLALMGVAAAGFTVAYIIYEGLSGLHPWFALSGTDRMWRFVIMLIIAALLLFFLVAVLLINKAGSIEIYRKSNPEDPEDPDFHYEDIEPSEQVIQFSRYLDQVVKTELLAA